MRITPIIPIYTKWDRKKKPKAPTKGVAGDIKKGTTYKEIANELRKPTR